MDGDDSELMDEKHGGDLDWGWWVYGSGMKTKVGDGKGWDCDRCIPIEVVVEEHDPRRKNCCCCSNDLCQAA